MYIYIYAYIHIQIYIYAYICICTYCVYHSSRCIQTHYKYIYILRMYICIYIYMCSHICTRRIYQYTLYISYHIISTHIRFMHIRVIYPRVVQMHTYVYIYTYMYDIYISYISHHITNAYILEWSIPEWSRCIHICIYIGMIIMIGGHGQQRIPKNSWRSV